MVFVTKTRSADGEVRSWDVSPRTHTRQIELTSKQGPQRQTLSPPWYHKISVVVEQGEIYPHRPPRVDVAAALEIVSGVATDAVPFHLQYAINKLDSAERSARIARDKMTTLRLASRGKRGRRG